MEIIKLTLGMLAVNCYIIKYSENKAGGIIGIEIGGVCATAFISEEMMLSGKLT